MGFFWVWRGGSELLETLWKLVGRADTQFLMKKQYSLKNIPLWTDYKKRM